MQNLTDEILLEKAQLARERQTKPEGGDVASAMSEVLVEYKETRSAACEREACGQTFQYSATLVGTKEYFRPKWCPACVSASWDQERRADRAQASFEQRLAGEDRETAVRRLLDEAGVNAWENGASTFGNFDVSEATTRPVTAARDFIGSVAAAGQFDAVRGLYLWGQTGCGKTHLAAASVRALIEADYAPTKIVFDHAAELIARIQDTYGTNASTFDVLEKRFAAGLWVLDDFGTERASEDATRHLTLIFSRRAMRPTLITSNLSADMLQRDRPDLMRVLSRLGPKYFRVVPVAGRDRRFD